MGMTDPRTASRHAAEDAIRELKVGNLDAARNSLARALQRVEVAIEEEG